jgi:hypothetical protein
MRAKTRRMTRKITGIVQTILLMTYVAIDEILYPPVTHGNRAKGGGAP